MRVEKRSWIRLVGGGLLAAAVAIQFVPVERTNPPVERVVQAPADVDSVLRRACWDCHSNRTDWPWYSRVAPISWLVADDVREGREHMNLTEWPSEPEEARDLIEEIGEEVESGAMPLTSYRILHPEARLSEETRQRLADWSMAAGGLDQLPTDLPRDGPGPLDSIAFVAPDGEDRRLDQGNLDAVDGKSGGARRTEELRWLQKWVRDDQDWTVPERPAHENEERQ